METLQIRLPKDVIRKVDRLIETGLFRTRSEILRQALQEYLLHSNFNGQLPFIVGPFANEDYLKAFDESLDKTLVSSAELTELRKKWKNVMVS